MSSRPPSSARSRSSSSALQQLSDRFASEQGKRVALVTMGLEDIPEPWISTLFDLLGQLLRNSIEHGIEPPLAAR